MTNEPVAYFQLDVHGNEKISIKKNMNYYETVPLYTKEQLQPRVQMTQTEFNEFDKAYSKYEFIHDLYVEKDTMFNNLLSYASRTSENEKNILCLWINYDKNNPEETIEIIPTKKWFIQKKDFNGDYRFLKISTKDLSFNYTKDKAVYFDTKEEAEKWTNPLTEAVLLPIEGE